MTTNRIEPKGVRHHVTALFSLILLHVSFSLPVMGASLGTPPPPGVAPVSQPAGGFAIDGNVLANQAEANTGDWLPGGTGTGGAVLNGSGSVLNPATTVHLVDVFGAGDTTFVGGTKWWQDPNTWEWTVGKASAKTDINNVLVHVTADAEGHVWAMVSADRSSTSGDSYIDFEFLQNSLTKNRDFTFTSTGPNAGRTTNDLLLSLAFTGGGDIANFFVWRWQATTNGFAYVECTAALPSNRVFAALNTTTIQVPYGAFGSTSYAPNSFAEAAVDLTALLSTFDPCLSVGIKTLMVKTKASQSDSATIEDMADPVQVQIRIGPSTDAGPNQAICWEQETNLVRLTGTATPGISPVESTTWSVVSGVATIEAPNSLVTTARVTSSSAVFRLTAVESFGCTISSEMTVTVLPAAVCSIEGPTVVCPRSTHHFRAPAGMERYAWSVSGDAAMVGATNAEVVEIVAGSSCGQNFSLHLKTVSHGCEKVCGTDILILDQTRPSITAPADLILECPAVISPDRTGTATASDECNRVAVAYQDAVTNQCGNTKIIQRTWTATDECGNSASATQLITVIDTLKPALTVPTAKTLECPADVTPASTGQATATDGCGAATVSYVDEVTSGCGNSKVVRRTWTATDACGNSVSGVQIITVQDTTRPVLTCPTNITLECPADLSPDRTGMATATDTCGQASVAYVDAVTATCPGAKLIQRTWTATDECGNSASAVQTITVRDTQKPVLTMPEDKTLECPADTTTNATGIATATDTCSQVSITLSEAVTNQCGPTRVILRTWTATDECGNSVSAIQRITVQDTQKPVLAVPADLVLECPADTTTNTTGVATATEACSQATVSYVDAVTDNCGRSKVIARTWTAIDACGNSVSAVQTITVLDTTRPVLTCPENKTLECPADTTTNATGVATATDACSAVTITFSDMASNNCGGTKIILRTWTAADECGNSVSAVQTITVLDTQRPTLVCPGDVTLECPADVSTNSTGVATAQDLCSQATIAYTDALTELCGQTKVIRRTWTATDECGNRVSAVQTITVHDTLRPVLTCPADLVLECPANIGTNATGVATATDACSPVSISFSDAVTTNCGNTRVIARTWTARDECGNNVSAVQTITVRDTRPPILRLPADLVLECPGDTRTNRTGVATAVDNCSGATITYSDVVSNSCGLTRTVWRLWTATDQCGNTTNGVQTIVVADTQKPAMTCPNISVQCPADVPSAYATLAAFLAGGGTAHDNCDTTLTFGLMSDSGIVGRCPGRVTRVYRVTDDCGNYGECTQTILVDDTIAPVLSTLTNVTVEWGTDLATLGQPSATDNCSTNINITQNDTVVGSEYNIHWYAADPEPNKGPYLPTYLKLAPRNLPCPETARLTGRAADPLRNAVAYATNSGQLDALTSMGGAPMALGQVVPFEAVIEVGGGPGPEHGTIEFTTSWSTHTTSNDRFGYDTNYMVYCAFVDFADPGLIDPHENARVESYRATVSEPGTINEKIQGTFRISGLDSGDRVVVEVWVVLMSTMSGNGGTIASDLVSAQKATEPPTPITTGAQTVGIGNLSKLSALPAPQPQPPLGPMPVQPPLLPGSTVAVIDRTWTATDECGNARTSVQRITLRYTTAPVMVTPPEAVLECPADTSPAATCWATATDVGGTVTIAYADATTTNCGAAKVIARTWTATDERGLSVSATQTIRVLDTQRPALVCPSNITLECPADTSPSNTGTATATDGCSSVTVSFTDAVSNSCAGTRTILRTWTALDQCGNSVSAVQSIAVVDSQKPLLVMPRNVVLPFPADTTPNVTGAATASDTCGQASVTYSDTVTTTCGSAQMIERTWTATDECGNTATGVQTISVMDTEAPSLMCSTNRTVQYGEPWQFAEPLAWDNSGEAHVAILSTITNILNESTFAVTRIWQAVDGCSNEATCQQTITVIKPAVPKLEIMSVSADKVIVRWPAAAVGYQLQASDSLANWASVTTTPVLSNNYYYVVLNRNVKALNFRLAFPKLEIHAAPPYGVELRWPMAAVGYELQASDNLKTWTRVMTAPTINSNYNAVVLKQGRYQHFRLNKPQ